MLERRKGFPLYISIATFLLSFIIFSLQSQNLPFYHVSSIMVLISVTGIVPISFIARDLKLFSSLEETKARMYKAVADKAQTIKELKEKKNNIYRRHNNFRKMTHKQKNIRLAIHNKIREAYEKRDKLHEEELKDYTKAKEKAEIFEREAYNFWQKLEKTDKEKERIRSEKEEIEVEFNLREQRLQKTIKRMKRRFEAEYPYVKFYDKAYKRLADLDPEQLGKAELQMQMLVFEPEKAKYRCRVVGTTVDEYGFTYEGRLYACREGNEVKVYCIGDKKTQEKDIEWLHNKCKQM